MMGTYVLYKCKMEQVDFVCDIPDYVKTFLEYKGYVSDEETVIEELDEGENENKDKILDYLRKHELFDYDLKMEYE